MPHSSPATIARFRRLIWQHYRAHGRAMPWRTTQDPYAILISECMLQQTQVDRVIRKYAAFMAQFPDFGVLARSPLRDVLAAWQGLGYNRRALWLHRLAKTILAQYEGVLPDDPMILRTLPGIGPGTAGAIAAFAFHTPTVFIETNIRRVFIHFFFSNPKKSKRRRSGATIGTGMAGVGDTEILSLVERTVSRKNPREWYYALMDYGAMLGQRRDNPNRRSKHYAVQPRFEGSRRQLRGKILAAFLAEPSLAIALLAKKLALPTATIKDIRNTLTKEGFIPETGTKPVQRRHRRHRQRRHGDIIT